MYNRQREGLFSVALPEARFAIRPCNSRYCHCCHPPCQRRYTTDEPERQVVPFSIPHVHHFVNGYEAILNCPAVRSIILFTSTDLLASHILQSCETTDCIYVLTCPCGKFDYIGQTVSSFATALACESSLFCFFSPI